MGCAAPARVPSTPLVTLKPHRSKPLHSPPSSPAVVQAYDLEDQWGSGDGPCFATPATHGIKQAWACCAGKGYNATQCAGREALCAPACSAAAGTSMVMGGIHPRSKKPCVALPGGAPLLPPPPICAPHP